MSEKNGSDLSSCGALYAQAALLLEAILQEMPPTFNNNQNDAGLPFVMDVPFETISSDDRAKIERLLSSLYFQVSRVKELNHIDSNNIHNNGIEMNPYSNTSSSHKSSKSNNQQSHQFVRR